LSKMSDFASKYDMAKKVGVATVAGFGHVMSCAASTANILDGTIDDIYSVSSDDSDTNFNSEADDATWTTFGEHTLSDGETATLNTLENGAASDDSGGWSSEEETIDQSMMSYDDSTLNGTLESKPTFESSTTGGSSFGPSVSDSRTHMGYSTSTGYSSNTSTYDARSKDSKIMASRSQTAEIDRSNSMIQSVRSGVSYKEQLWLEAQEQLHVVSHEDSALQQDLAEFSESEKRWLTEAESEVGGENIPHELLSRDFMKRLAENERVLDDAEEEAAALAADQLLQLKASEEAAEREAERLEEEQRAEREAKEKRRAEEKRIEEEQQIAEALRASEAALEAVNEKFSNIEVAEDAPASEDGDADSQAFDPPGIVASYAFEEDAPEVEQPTAETEPVSAVEIGSTQIEIEIDNEEAHADDDEEEVIEQPPAQAQINVEVELDVLDLVTEEQVQEEEESPVEETQHATRYHEIVIDTTKPGTHGPSMKSYDITRGNSNATEATVDTAASWSSSPISDDHSSLLSSSGHNSLSFSGHGSISNSVHSTAMSADGFHHQKRPVKTLESIEEVQHEKSNGKKKNGKVKKGIKKLFSRREKNPTAFAV